jgi:hypothetical protein
MEAAATEDNPATLQRRKSGSQRLPETNERDEEDGEDSGGPNGHSKDLDDIASAFPSYMSPEKVQYVVSRPNLLAVSIQYLVPSRILSSTCFLGRLHTRNCVSCSSNEERAGS